MLVLWTSGRNRCGRFGMVCEELLEPAVGQRMLEQAFDGAQRAGHDVRPDFRAIDDVHGVADTRRKDLRLEHVIVVDPSDLLNELDPIA